MDCALWADGDLVDGLRSYIKKVMSYPLLSEKDEFDYAHAFRLHHDLRAAQNLILSHLRLVVSISREYKGYSLPQADLIQEGNVGLMHAVKRFDPEKGVRLVTFATYWIRAAITNYIVKNWRLVKIATTKAQRKLFFNLRKLKDSSKPFDSEQADEIARVLGVKKKDVWEAHDRLSCREMSIHEALPSDDRNHENTWENLIRDPRQMPHELVEKSNDLSLKMNGLNCALEQLNDRARHIITERWLHKTDKPKTLQDISKELGISAERVRQIESESLAKLKEGLKAFH